MVINSLFHLWSDIITGINSVSVVKLNSQHLLSLSLPINLIFLSLVLHNETYNYW